jgi:hypothetical protein
MHTTRLLTDKKALDHTRIDEVPSPPAAQGEAILRVRRLALTTNNITYAAFGEAMQYWEFFPTGQPGWGHMPAWGFADVEASTVPGVDAGERFYGYFPLATRLRVQPVRVTPRGFYDGAAHRLPLVSAYNQYTRCSADAAYRAADEDLQMLLRPLFITSFMLADFLQDNGFFGARRLVFSSASSKTAFGTAFCLQDVPGIERIALTSPGNLGFVRGLGCYDGAVAYDEVASLDASGKTLYVDFSGAEPLRAAVHAHFGDALAYDCFAGSAQNTGFLRDTGLPGPKPQFYFAPVQIRKRNADWGPAEVTRRFNEAQLAFIRRVQAPPVPWVRVQHHEGLHAAQPLIERLHAGRVDPREGHVVELG